MKIDWILVRDWPPPFHTGLDCLVCTGKGIITIAQYHSDPEGWWLASGSAKLDDVIAYVYLHDLPRPVLTTITNDKWVELAAKQGVLE